MEWDDGDLGYNYPRWNSKDNFGDAFKQPLTR